MSLHVGGLSACVSEAESSLDDSRQFQSFAYNFVYMSHTTSTGIIEDSVGIVQTALFMHEQIVYLDTRFTASSLTHHHHPLGQAFLRKNCSNRKQHACV